jgi:hypothetical protein
MSEVLPPSDSTVTWVTCPKCSAQMPAHDPSNSRYFGCFNCRTYFTTDPTAANNTARIVSGFKKALAPGPRLTLGAIGELGGYRCRLTGYQVRGEQQDRSAQWREYQLRPAEPILGDDPIDFPLQLAEYQGHWLLIRRARDFPSKQNPRTEGALAWTDAKGREYRLWHRYKPVIADALGEFDWNILDDEELTIAEYVSPPYLLAAEQHGRDLPTWYLAEYLEPAQVAAVFSPVYKELPQPIGIGAAQPGPIQNWPQLRRLGWATLFALVIMQLSLLLLRQPTTLLAQDFTTTETSPGGTNQVLVSKSFDIGGPSALDVELAIPALDNHWVEVTASLVNEQTGRGYEFTRSVEYYHGYEDGENWHEGEHSVNAVLSHVPAGRYHFNLYPSLDQGLGTTNLTLYVEQNTPLWTNFWLMLLGLGLVPVLLGWRHLAFEHERWANSDFNPYASSFE